MSIEQSQYRENQIVGRLKEADAGSKVADVCRKYWGLQLSDVRPMPELKLENGRLKRMLRIWFQEISETIRVPEGSGISGGRKWRVDVRT